MCFRVLAFAQQAEDQRQLRLLVELQALLVHFPVHVYRQVGQPHQRLFEAQQPRFLPRRPAQHDAPGQTQVPVGEGGQYRPAINFDPQAHQAIAGQGRLRLEPQARRIGMGADDAKAGFRQRPAAQHEGDQRRTAAHRVIAPARRKLPALALLEPGEALRQQARLGARHCVPGAGAGVDEVD